MRASSIQTIPNGLDQPGGVQAAEIDRLEPGIRDQAENSGLAGRIVAGHEHDRRRGIWAAVRHVLEAGLIERLEHARPRCEASHHLRARRREPHREAEAALDHAERIGGVD